VDLGRHQMRVPRLTKIVDGNRRPAVNPATHEAFILCSDSQPPQLLAGPLFNLLAIAFVDPTGVGRNQGLLLLILAGSSVRNFGTRK
jgi:hypothetical protein